jgi:hypothetical protein
VGQVRLHGQAERPQRPPHRVPDPHDPSGDAIPGQQLAFGHTAPAWLAPRRAGQDGWFPIMPPRRRPGHREGHTAGAGAWGL